MNQLRVVIADDELLAREAIRLRLNQFKTFDVIAEADNGADALLLCQTLKPDVLFLDINMPKMTGLETAAFIEETSNTLLVFITAYNQHAVEAFRKNATDYLTKPIDDDEFADMLAKIQRRHMEKKAVSTLKHDQAVNSNNRWLKRMSVKEAGDTRLIEVSKIVSITSVKDYLCIVVSDKVYIHRQTMLQMEQQLNPAQFIRCHRSHIVNKAFIDSWVKEGNADYLVIGENKHPVSRRYKPLVKKAL